MIGALATILILGFIVFFIVLIVMNPKVISGLELKIYRDEKKLQKLRLVEILLTKLQDFTPSTMVNFLLWTIQN